MLKKILLMIGIGASLILVPTAAAAQPGHRMGVRSHMPMGHMPRHHFRGHHFRGGHRFFPRHGFRHFRGHPGFFIPPRHQLFGFRPGFHGGFHPGFYPGPVFLPPHGYGGGSVVVIINPCC